MLGFKVGNQQLIDVVVPMGAEHTNGWRRAFLECLSAFNYTIAQQFGAAYGLVARIITNNSQREYLNHDEHEEADAYCTAWVVAGTREDLVQVITGDGEGGPADGSVRVALAKFLREGQVR
jgi:hypothetical protein